VSATGGSVGPITLTNNVNVVPLSQAQPQRLVQYTLPTPVCNIYASAAYSTGYYNQPVTLTWNSTNAMSAYITPQLGSVSPSGTQIVYPNGYTTYTMTVSGPGGTATCQVNANYTNTVAPVYAQPTYIPPTYYQPTPHPVVYTQPATPSVSLTQIPYTGFDYGPIGNAIYWFSLLSFAVAAAYLIVYFRGGALALALAGSIVGRTRRSSGSDVEAETEAEPFVIAETVIPQPKPAPALSRVALPTIENYRMTTDSMLFDRTSNGMPRIVIART
jgi:hypothetical protein